MTQDFKATGSTDIREAIAALPDDMLEPKQRLEKLVKNAVRGKQFSELTEVTYHHDGSTLAGHAMLDALETAGFGIDDFDAVGALTTAAIPLVTAMIAAAASRGQNLDGFAMDFVFPSIKGPSIKDKRVILVDAWLSEKSFVQTSSVVTLTHGNELNLDFGVLESQGAKLLAITSLVGSTGVVENYTVKSDEKSGLSALFGDAQPHCECNGEHDGTHTCCHSENEAAGEHHCAHEGEEDHECTCGGHGHNHQDSSEQKSQDSLMIRVINPVTENSAKVPFIPVFSDKELQA